MKKILFHHCIALSDVVYGTIIPSIEHTRRHIIKEPDDTLEFEESFIKPNLWLQEQVGFYPIFMAAGETLEDIDMTGYGRQWAKNIGSYWDKQKNKSVNVLRKKGEFPNEVLFSYNYVSGIFIDYDDWFIALNSSWNNYKVSPGYTKRILKKSWSRADWLRKARKFPGTVMYVVPSLDLRTADRIWARNKLTKISLERMGFSNVEVKRIPATD